MSSEVEYESLDLRSIGLKSKSTTKTINRGPLYFSHLAPKYMNSITPTTQPSFLEPNIQSLTM
jgi:hypothetical protein